MARIIEVEPASCSDLPAFLEMERAADTEEFIRAYSLSDHKSAFSAPDTVYLKITEGHKPIGFFILVADKARCSIEFRRVVVRVAARGVGQLAIQLMEQYCRDTFAFDRIWLDVFERNSRAVHIYEKLGYKRFGTKGVGCGRLALYQKLLSDSECLGKRDVP